MILKKIKSIFKKNEPIVNDRTFSVFTEKESLLSSVEEQITHVSADLKSASKYYFIARYAVSVHESRFGEITIQVWNEYRNAMDHFFRCQASESNDHNQLRKMEGHLLRAALDALKILCHKSIDEIDSEKNKHDRQVLSLVDNGDFYSILLSDSAKARKIFEQAKTEDILLGADSIDNVEVLEKYLNAFFALDNIILAIVDKQAAIATAYKSRDSISHTNTWHHIKTHYVFYISLALLGIAWTQIKNDSNFVALTDKYLPFLSESQAAEGQATEDQATESPATEIPAAEDQATESPAAESPATES
jgi:hypothetical protein